MADKQFQKERLIEFDILRAFAIFGVMLIHILGASFLFQAKWGLTWNIFVVFDQFLRFAVPVFVFLSGYTLGLKYLHKKFSLTEFYRKRVWRILPWYFFWSGVIYIYTHYIVLEKDYHYPVWKLIFLGKTDYHLYFVSLIFQLYILFPFILYLLNKFGRKFVAFTFLFQTVLYLFVTSVSLSVIRLSFYLGDQQQYVFFGSWIFYFVIGIVFAQKKYGFSEISKIRKFALLLTFAGFVLTVADSFWIVRVSGDLIVATRSSRVTTMLYACGWLISAAFWGRNLLKLPNIVKKFLVYIGNRSYLIYLLHTLVIRIVAHFIFPVVSRYISLSNGLNLVPLTLLIVALSILMAEFFERTGRFVFATVFRRLLFAKI